MPIDEIRGRIENIHFKSEGPRPSDSPTRSLVGPRKLHSARVALSLRSFA